MLHVRRRIRDAERDAPVGCLDVLCVYTAGGGDVLAACECGRGAGAGISEQFVLVHRRRELPAIDGRNLLRDAKSLIAVVCDEDCRQVLRGENLTQCHLDLPLEMCVECGERLVEEQHIRTAREDARKGNALLLPAREACGVGIFQSVEGEASNVLFEDALLFLARTVQCEDDVLTHGHIRKESIVLKEIADAARLRREVDALFAVKEDALVQDNLSAVGTLEPRDALERHALAAARCAEEGEGRVREGKVRCKSEVTQAFFNIDDQLHQRTSRLRYRFIAPIKKSENREMMIAQRKARS